jgi:molybdenum cofactor guanylyltransferase
MIENWQLLMLAGGEGRRLGGIDKGLMRIDGQPALLRLCERFHPPRLLVSANRHLDQYRALGVQPVTDKRGHFAGPLAGLEALLAEAADLPALVVPCDMPSLPGDLPAQLFSQLQNADTIVVAHDGERLQPLCMALWPARWRADLSAWLDQGHRSVHGWLENKPVVVCHFEDPVGFRNINTPENL